MALADKFFPKQEKMNKLTYTEREKLRSLVNGDLICILVFFLFTVGLLFTQFRFVGLLMFITMACFAVSLILVRFGRIYTASYMATAGFIIGNFIINFFVGDADTGFIFFRGACFAVVMANMNYIISIKKGQLIFFHIASQLILIATALTVYWHVVVSQPIIQIITISSCCLGMMSANLILSAINRQSIRIIGHAEKSEKQSSEQIVTITNVLSQTKQSLNIGQELNVSANSASKSAMIINSLYMDLTQSAEKLKEQTENVKNYSEEVNQQAGLMSEEVQKQNVSLSQTSTAITEISANILSINQIAEKRRSAMEEAVEILDQQGHQVQSLVEKVEKVKESSDAIAKFVKTVDDIAGQTNLLAMNASIEAAHAGTLGKGFSVIAQQIRKLSEETSKNASKIAETLKENTEVVQETSDSVAEFAESTGTSIEEIRSTVASMEEIIRGISEMSRATMEVSNSIQGIVQISCNTEEIIENVVGQISEQDSSLVDITNATETLKERIDAIKAELLQINDAIDVIHVKAKDNEEVSGRIASLLD